MSIAFAIILSIMPIEAEGYNSVKILELQPRYFMELQTNMIASNLDLVDVRVKYVYNDGYGQIQSIKGITEISYKNGYSVVTDPVITGYTFTNNRRTCTVKFSYKLYATSSSSYKDIYDSVTFDAPY